MTFTYVVCYVCAGRLHATLQASLGANPTLEANLAPGTQHVAYNATVGLLYELN